MHMNLAMVSSTGREKEEEKFTKRKQCKREKKKEVLEVL